MQTPSLPYDFTSVDDGEGSDDDEDDDSGAAGSDEPASGDAGAAGADTVLPSDPSTSVTPVTFVERTATAPGTTAATAFACASCPAGYCTWVVFVSSEDPGAPTWKPRAVRFSPAAAAAPVTPLPFRTVTVVAAGSAAVAFVYSWLADESLHEGGQPDGVDLDDRQRGAADVDRGGAERRDRRRLDVPRP